MLNKDFVEKLDQAPEVLVYMTIENLGGYAWRMSHELNKGNIPKEEVPKIELSITEANKQIRHIVENFTPRFGIEQPIDETNRPTEEYWKWYRWWKTWHQGMSDEQWRIVNNMISLDMTEEQLVICRPQGDWK